MNKGIVITGIGVLSPVATGREAFWDALLQGKTGFRPITLFDTTPFRCGIAGEINDFDPVALLGKKGLRDLDRSTRLICSAARLAIEDSRLDITESNNHSIGVAVGSTFGSLHSISQFDRSGLLEGPRSVNPSHFPNTVINSPASQVSIRFKIKGFNTTVSTGFCASLDAVSYAADFIRLGRASVVLAGGVEELCEETFRLFHDLGYLSGSDGSEPICCPFDARRNGTILSEGAAFLVLEDEQHALERNAFIHAKVLGYGNAFDTAASGDFNHAGEGLKDAITRALQDASLRPVDVEAVFSSANSIEGFDRIEINSIRGIFGDRARSLPVTAVKSMIGESYSASGALTLAAAVGGLQKQMLPPTKGHQDRNPDGDLDYVTDGCRPQKINHVLITSADPYGQNTAVILGR